MGHSSDEYSAAAAHCVEAARHATDTKVAASLLSIARNCLHLANEAHVDQPSNVALSFASKDTSRYVTPSLPPKIPEPVRR